MSFFELASWVVGASLMVSSIVVAGVVVKDYRREKARELARLRMLMRRLELVTEIREARELRKNAMAIEANKKAIAECVAIVERSNRILDAAYRNTPRPRKG